MSRRCASKKRHFQNSRQAKDRLDEILSKPLAPDRMYSPTGVMRCHCGGWVLTSRLGKQWAKGKKSRDRRLR